MSNDSEAKRKAPAYKPDDSRASIDETAVADYLLAYPDFFERHKGLLMKLKIAHPTGEAVSLIERQVELLRNQNRTLERRLVDLVEVARSNDSVLERLHELSVALLGADEPGDRIRVLEDSLRSRFGADRVRLLLFAGQTERLGLDNVERVERNDLTKFKRFLDEDKAFCGRLRPAQLEFLFAEHAARIASAALVPIGSHARFGMLALGSEQAEHFSPTLGTAFLTRIGELTEQALASLLKE
ncbi:MAG TPA: DUF484 family protein [Gammaproteobacteria bacterium]|nr:DUF484 family protein [Gammaproteobacteria bacterium]